MALFRRARPPRDQELAHAYWDRVIALSGPWGTAELPAGPDSVVAVHQRAWRAARQVCDPHGRLCEPENWPRTDALGAGLLTELSVLREVDVADALAVFERVDAGTPEP